jgi:hypothetical protein
VRLEAHSSAFFGGNSLFSRNNREFRIFRAPDYASKALQVAEFHGSRAKFPQRGTGNFKTDNREFACPEQGIGIG